MPYRAAKGMNDILPDDVRVWQRLEAAFRTTVERYGYGEVRTPLLEPTELFVRSVGEATDIVQKEMFTLQHHDDSLTLRPEGTASAARAYVEHAVQAKEPLTRWYYLGPMFRAERPQRGRYRQFYQAGCEIFGDAGPASDAEMIDMLYRFFRGLGIADVQVLVNSLGSPGTRERYRDLLRQHLDAAPGRAQRKLAATARRQPASHPRLQESSRSGARARRAADHRSPRRRGPRALGRSPPLSRRARSSVPGRNRRSSGGSTTTRARSSS